MTGNDQVLSAQRQGIRRDLIGLLVICVAGLALRLVHASERFLWFDEAFCWHVGTQSFADNIRLAASDFHPPGYFLVLRAWMLMFGEAAISLRLLSMLFGVSTIAGAYFLAAAVTKNEAPGSHGGTDTESSVAGLVAAALIATAASHVIWSQQVRMYSMAIALAVWSSFFFLRLVEGSLKRTDVFGYTLLATLLCYTHNFGLFTVASQVLFAAASHFKQRFLNHSQQASMPVKSIVISTACVVLLYCPWMLALFSQMDSVRQDYWIQPIKWNSIPIIFSELTIPALSAAESAARIFEEGIVSLEILIATGIVVVTLKKSRLLLLACLVAGPIVAAVSVSLAITPIVHARYFLPAHALFLVLLAALVVQIPFRSLRLASIALLLGGNTYWTVMMLDSLDVANRPGAKALASHIATAGDKTPIVVQSPMLFHSMLYHVHGAREVRLLHTEPVKRYFGGSILREQQLIDRNELDQYNEFWFVERSRHSYAKEPWIANLKFRPQWTEQPESYLSAKSDRLYRQYGFDDLQHAIRFRRSGVAQQLKVR